MAKKLTTRKADKGYGMSEAVEFLMSIPEIAESFTRADIELAIDDQGYERFNTNLRQFVDLDQQTRNTLISKSRLYWLRDPLAKQAVRLWTDYSVGTGITFKTEDETSQALLTGFMRNRDNKKLTSRAGQQRLSKKLLVDGELFFAIFTQAENKVLRTLDPLQITDIITDPDDEDRVLAYRRQTSVNKILFYADWTAGDDGIALAEKQKDPHSGKTIKELGGLQPDVVVYHLPFDSIASRGNGLLSAAAEWSVAHRKFMEARIAIVAALSKFATKVTVKGGQQVLNSIKSRLESTLAQTGTTGGVEKQPKPAPGGTWLQNAGMDLQAMPRSTGGSEAKDDSDNLKLMVCAATGIMLHYFGDPSTGNLATATAMELPMLKQFAGYQELWKDIWRDIFSIVMDEDPDEEPLEIDIDLPPILSEDLQKLGAYIAQVSTVFPEIKVPDVLQMLLQALGINNLEEVMKAIDVQRTKNEADQKAQQDLMAKTGQMTPAQQAQMKESYHELAVAFNRLADKVA